MATLTVWEFPDSTGADMAVATLQDLQKHGLIKVHDGAVVSWALDAKKPKTRQLLDLKGAGALGGAFWGLLFGMLFLVPLLGMAVGAAAGALSGSLTDVGINDSFIRQIRDKIKPGTSALFVLTSDAVVDKVLDAFADQQMDLITTNLSKEEEAKLQEIFAD